MYIIYTGQFEKGTKQQQEAFFQLFGAENAQYLFDFYFHWYNIAHEYGHCLCDYYQSDTTGLKQELLVNRFAVSIWRYAGYEKQLQGLQEMLDEILQKIKNPVPDHMSFADYYEQIWGTEQLMEVSTYGYLQFKSVQTALEGSEKLEDILQEMGIQIKIRPAALSYKDCAISPKTAKEALSSLQQLLHDWGIEQPAAAVKMVDDPTFHCAKPAHFPG